MEIKRAKGIVYKMFGEPTEYVAPNGKSLKELENELKNIRKALNLDEDDEDYDVIDVLNQKLEQKNKRIQNYRDKLKEATAENREYKDMIDTLEADIEKKRRQLKKSRKSSSADGDIDLPSIPYSASDANKVIATNLKEYKDYLQKMRLEIEKFKMDIMAYFSMYKKHFDDKMKSEIEKRRKQLLEKRAACLKLKEEADRLAKENSDLEKEKNKYSAVDPNATKLNITAGIAESPQDIRDQFNKMIRDYNDVFDRYKQKDLANCEAQLAEFNIKMDKLSISINGLIGKVQAIQARVKKTNEVDRPQAKAQANELMQNFLRTLWMKEKLKVILTAIEPKLKEHADKFEKQIEVEKENKGKILYDNLTANDLRRLIVLYIKENARFNLEDQDMIKNYELMTMQLEQDN